MELKEFTLEELAQFDGKDGRAAYVVFGRKVFDVSGSRLWRGGTHVKRHEAGHDLTTMFPEAPHGDEVFKRVTQVGVVKKAVSAEPEVQIPSWANIIMEMHSHPILVHFPQSFLSFAPLFIILFYATGNPYFERTAYYLLACGLLMALPTYATGLVHWAYKYARNPGVVYKFKIVMPLIMMAYVTAVFLRHAALGALPRSPINYSFLAMYLLIIPIISSIGYAGGIIVFGGHKKK